MKRKHAGLLTALMVLAMGTTAFAAGSPNSGSNSGNTGSTSTTPSTSQGTAIGNATNTKITQVSEAVADSAKRVASVVSPDAQVMAVVDVTYDGVIPAGGVQISFSLAGVQAGDNYVLLHQLADGRWEKITPDSIENGMIKATFTSLSPVAFVKIPSAQNVPAPGTNDANNGANGTTNKPGTTTSTSNTAAKAVTASPKTGAALPVLPVLAMICAAGIVVCGRKVKFND